MSKESKKKSSSSSGMIGTADEKALLYPMMRLSQDIHHSIITKNIDLELKVFEEISIELENPYLYSYYRNLMYPNHTFPSLENTSTTSDSAPTSTENKSTTGTTTSADDTMITSDLPDSSSIAAKATIEDLQQMKLRNDIVLKELEVTIEEAVESAGDMEVLDAHIAVAQYKAKAYSKDETIASYETILALPKISSGKKIDILMSVARVTSFYNDLQLTDEYLSRATTLAEAGGGSDWDRRNRLKIYNAIQLLLHRNIHDASKLLFDCISTFNAIEYCTYNEFITYTILSNLLHLSRPELKKNIIDGSEIITISAEIPEIVCIYMLLISFVRVLLCDVS
jgi:hypothetical protein